MRARSQRCAKKSDGGQAVSRIRRLLAGAGILTVTATIGTQGIVANADNDRVIALHNIHTGETISVLYKKGGRYVAAGMEKVNWILRDWRRNETTSMDPELIDLLWEMHAELGSKEPIHVISGYRSRNTNEMLRKTVGGQASQSRHILGKAADVHFPDVPLKNLRYSALIRERGGVGYYPTSAIPFVHVDTDRVRAWPRLPRYELALLFPQGRTHHLPADGGPITRDDVRIARAQHAELATQIAEFRSWREKPKAPFAVADASGADGRKADRPPRIPSLGTPLPALVERPRPATDPRLAIVPTPSVDDRARLTELAALASLEPRLVSGPTPATRRRPSGALASLNVDGTAGMDALRAGMAPGAGWPLGGSKTTASLGSQPRTEEPDRRLGWGTGWVAAPAYDDEHPEDLSYRPFPIGPLLTITAHDKVFADLVHHDVARTLDMLDQPGTALPLRFRPGEQMAQLMWAQQFRGDPIGLAKLYEAQSNAPIPANLQNRNVRTTGR
jgi:uncharacterized protein YcbK (DUF882 family)